MTKAPLDREAPTSLEVFFATVMMAMFNVYVIIDLGQFRLHANLSECKECIDVDDCFHSVMKAWCS